MATIIPSSVPAELREKSRAEFDIYREFIKSELDDNVYILHSLHLISHGKKILGTEIDFLVISKNGVFGLEVKGGGISRDENGSWFTTNRYGSQNRLKESPIEQVKQSIGQLKNWIRDNTDINVNEVVFGYGVILPGVSEEAGLADIVGPSASHEIFYWRNDLKRDIRIYIEKLARFYRNKIDRETTQLSRPEIENIKNSLMGNFKVVEDPLWHRHKIESDQLYFTDEQFKVNEMLLGGKAVISGAAGTGKTFIAEHFAIRQADRGLKVIFIVFNTKLAKTLEQSVLRNCQSISQKNIKICTFHSFLISFISDIKSHPNSSNYQDFSSLIEQAIDGIVTGKKIDCDQLIIDEGQDILTNETLIFFDYLRESAGKDFNWVWFLDPCIQSSVFGKFEISAYRELRQRSNREQTLTVNCRNTHEIASAAGSVCDIKAPHYCNQHGPDVNWILLDSKITPEKLLRKEIHKFLQHGLQPHEITIITLVKFTDTFLAEKTESDGVNVFYAVDSFKIAIHTASSFKGLESPGVIVLNIDDSSFMGSDWVSSVLYVAISRARYICSVITSKYFNDLRVEKAISLYE